MKKLKSLILCFVLVFATIVFSACKYSDKQITQSNQNTSETVINQNETILLLSDITLKCEELLNGEYSSSGQAFSSKNEDEYVYEEYDEYVYCAIEILKALQNGATAQSDIWQAGEQLELDDDYYSDKVEKFYISQTTESSGQRITIYFLFSISTSPYSEDSSTFNLFAYDIYYYDNGEFTIKCEIERAEKTKYSQGGVSSYSTYQAFEIIYLEKFKCMNLVSFQRLNPINSAEDVSSNKISKYKNSRFYFSTNTYISVYTQTSVDDSEVKNEIYSQILSFNQLEELVFSGEVSENLEEFSILFYKLAVNLRNE